MLTRSTLFWADLRISVNATWAQVMGNRGATVVFTVCERKKTTLKKSTRNDGLCVRAEDKSKRDSGAFGRVQ